MIHITKPIAIVIVVLLGITVFALAKMSNGFAFASNENKDALIRQHFVLAPDLPITNHARKAYKSLEEDAQANTAENREVDRKIRTEYNYPESRTITNDERITYTVGRQPLYVSRDAQKNKLLQESGAKSAAETTAQTVVSPVATQDGTEIDRIARDFLRAHCNGRYSTAATNMTQAAAGDYDRGAYWSWVYVEGNIIGAGSKKIKHLGVDRVTDSDAVYHFDVEQQDWASGEYKPGTHRKLLFRRENGAWKIVDCQEKVETPVTMPEGTAKYLHGGGGGGSARIE